MTYFSYKHTSTNGWMILPEYEQFGNPYIHGSYSLFAARIMGMSWSDWLEYCEQNGAVLYGKSILYIQAIWKEPNQAFLKELNKRAAEVAKIIDIKRLDW